MIDMLKTAYARYLNMWKHGGPWPFFTFALGACIAALVSKSKHRARNAVAGGVVSSYFILPD